METKDTHSAPMKIKNIDYVNETKLGISDIKINTLREIVVSVKQSGVAHVDNDLIDYLFPDYEERFKDFTLFGYAISRKSPPLLAQEEKIREFCSHWGMVARRGLHMTTFTKKTDHAPEDGIIALLLFLGMLGERVDYKVIKTSERVIQIPIFPEWNHARFSSASDPTGPAIQSETIELREWCYNYHKKSDGSWERWRIYIGWGDKSKTLAWKEIN